MAGTTSHGTPEGVREYISVSHHMYLSIELVESFKHKVTAAVVRDRGPLKENDSATRGSFVLP